MSRIVSVVTLIGTLALAPALASAESTLSFTGFSVSPDSWYAHLGATTALNHDIYKDGFLLRGSVGGGRYDYDAGATKIDGDVVAIDTMLGYQHYFTTGLSTKSSRVTGYVGGDYQNHDLSPNDPASRVNGHEFGLKGQAELVLNLSDKVLADLVGNYSGAFDTYWSRSRLSYDFGPVAIGPEATFLGSKSFDQQRLGMFANIPLAKNVVGSIGGGYSDAKRRGEDGGYADISVSCVF